ncbi:MAG: DUF4982 domain-containing protein [Thermoguttaceae bacterium]|nr:DUF4982 domain-containing protein [Thermoguttaceae bacterium]
MKRVFLSIFLTAVLLGMSRAAEAENIRKTIDFNENWTFALVSPGDERAESVTNAESRNSKKIGAKMDWEKTREPRVVRLPHDWAIEGPFDTNPKTWGGQGKLPWRGVGWYSKKFNLSAEEAAGRVVFDFGGCMAFPEVFINGVFAGGWDYGYQSFQVDASRFVHEGENTVSVRCDTRRHGSRWYPGAGIYRPVKMIFTSREMWLPEGAVFVSTPDVSKEKAVVEVQICPEFGVNGERGVEKEWNVRLFLNAPNGRDVEIAPQIVQKDAKSAILRFSIGNPEFWDVEEPNLYLLRVQITPCSGTDSFGFSVENSPEISIGDSGKDSSAFSEAEKPLFGFCADEANASDEAVIPFGVRTFRWTSDDGFHLNGRRVQLYGVNLHHDQGILGAAAHPAAVERQLRIMKEMGVNAVRTSHNPSSREFLDICDRLGLIVWNELFDKWNETADLLDQKYFDAFVLRQVRRFVERDRNHSCVFVWSIGNEIWDIEGNIKGPSNPNLDAPRRVKYAADCFRRFDATRPVGFGCFVEGTCGPENHVRDSLDITGWNYGAKYREARERYPEMPLVYTESASAVSSRGFYRFPHPLTKETYDTDVLQVDGYDWVSASGPRDIPDVDFDRMETDRYVAGEFVWTGFDYLGEPTPFDRQARSSYFGIVDLCGLPKDRYFLYRSYWAPEKTTVHILPHWNWEGKQKEVPVYVYSNGDEAELFLNGKSLGRKAKLKTVNPAPAVRPEWDLNTKFTASSVQGGNSVRNAFDTRKETRWCAADGSSGQWLQADFGKLIELEKQTILLEKAAENYRFHVEVSKDGENWETIFSRDRKGHGNSVTIPAPEKKTLARFVRLVFDQLWNNSWASVFEWSFSEARLSPGVLPQYYAVIDKYRMRWENVPFEPGILEAVAYRNGKEIGRQTVRTAGKPAAIRLTPEKKQFADDDDLIYVLAEAVDENGVPCPWDERKIRAKVTGPAELVGIDAGNPMCFETIPDAEHSLFFGKAVLVLRSRSGEGNVLLEVTADGLESGKTAF